MSAKMMKIGRKVLIVSIDLTVKWLARRQVKQKNNTIFYHLAWQNNLA